MPDTPPVISAALFFVLAYTINLHEEVNSFLKGYFDKFPVLNVPVENAWVNMEWLPDLSAILNNT